LEARGAFTLTALGNTILLAEEGHPKMVRYLLDNGANKEATDSEWNYTPLHLSSKEGREEVVMVLLEKNANVHAQDSDGNTPLHLAAAKKFENIIKLLLKAKANPEFKNSAGEHPTGLDKATVERLLSDSD